MKRAIHSLLLAINPMQIHLVNRFYWPDQCATAQILTDLAEHITLQGHSVTVHTSRQLLESAEAQLPATETRQRVHIQRVPTTMFGRYRGLALRTADFLSFYPSIFISLLRRLHRGDVVIALTDPPMVSVVTALACKLRHARNVQWLQDFYPEVAIKFSVLQHDGWLARVLIALRNWGLRQSACNVAIGEHMAQRIRAVGARVEVIHNWSPDLLCDAAPQASNSYRLNSGCGSRLLICYSGNLGRAHRFEAMVAASARLQPRCSHHFMIIGGGHQYEQIRKTVELQKLTDWTFLPFQSRAALTDSLGAADIHVVSLDPELEGLIVPSKLYGVFAAGRACIFLGGTHGEVADLLRLHDCGWVIAPDDSDGLASLLTRLAIDRDEVAQKGRNARLAFEQFYTPERAFAQWSNLLDSLSPSPTT